MANKVTLKVVQYRVADSLDKLRPGENILDKKVVERL